jgi:hypothetical protein
MRDGGRALFAVLNLYARIKIHVATFDTNHSITSSTQSITASIQKLPDSAVKSVSQLAIHSRCVRQNIVNDQFEVSL